MSCKFLYRYFSDQGTRLISYLKQDESGIITFTEKITHYQLLNVDCLQKSQPQRNFAATGFAAKLLRFPRLARLSKNLPRLAFGADTAMAKKIQIFAMAEVKDKFLGRRG